ncbi:MAG: MoxR family ATPase [Verrucomicrobiota bacterium]
MKNTIEPMTGGADAVAAAGATRIATGGDSIETANEAVHRASAWVEPLRREIGRTIVGQQDLVDRLLVALLADGHVLLEGVPGLAKTLTLKTLSEAVDTGFQRIQFTPDMLPADIVGTEIFRPGTTDFVVKQGPVFSNLILADEINRAPSKVQSALLEAMQERQVTIGDVTYPLPAPFLVLATQNPIEQEGTYPLPEAQVDRFMLKVVIGHPSIEEERAILDRAATLASPAKTKAVVHPHDIMCAREVVNTIHMDDRVKDYIVSLVFATREPGRYGLDMAALIENGASPRATINLTLASKAVAFLSGRGYVTPQDVKTIAMDVLRHRVSITYEAEAEEITSENLVTTILDTVPVP